MSLRERCVEIVKTLPEEKFLRVMGYIECVAEEEYPNDTEYLKSIPGMWESIEKGIRTPSSECIPIEKVWKDVFN